MSVELKLHNQIAYDEVDNILKKDNKAAVIHPTGTGKTSIAEKLIEDNSGKKVIYLSPATSIMHQLKRNMIKDKVDFRNVKRYTYQKLTSLNRNNRMNLDADIIILDEFHHCGAPEWGKAVEELLQRNPNAKILGLSATPMRYFDGEIRDMAEELFDGNIASEISLEDAIATEILSEPVYTTGFYEYEEITRELEEQIRKCNDLEKRQIAQDELAKLKKMLEASVKGLPELLGNSMTNKSGKYIVYCRDIEDMQKKIEQAQEMFGHVNPEMDIMSISSKNSDHENESTVRRFEKDNDEEKLKLLFSVDMLNEGYHLNDLDGVVMMRPTHSPTLYYQQLGRALSVGSERQPIVIDLVNNIDTIEIIEGFSRSLGAAKGRRGKDNTSKPFSISADTRKIREIIDKISTLTKRRDSLNNEEKLALMTEYLRETGEKITPDTTYKGYNLGSMRNNLRAAYYNGTLKIEEDLLKEFMDNGIIVAEKERIKTSAQEKYEFLMSMAGKGKEELESAQMESGMSYSAAKRQVQSDYNQGKLRLTPEQIADLKKCGQLNPSPKEKEELGVKYDLPWEYAFDIEQKYGSLEAFLEKYKKGEIDYEFNEEIFCGYRGIVISEKDISEAQKLGYGRLYDEIFRYDEKSKSVDLSTAIDVDKIERVMSSIFDERYLNILRARFGLLDGRVHSSDELSKSMKVGRSRIGQLENKAIRMLVSPSRRRLIKAINPIQEYKRYQAEYANMQECAYELNTIKTYITNPDGSPRRKKEIKDMKLSELGIAGRIFSGEESVENMTIYDLIENQEAIKNDDDYKNISIEEFDFSVRLYNILKRANINTLKDILEHSEIELRELRNMGNNTFSEIMSKINELGLTLRNGEKNETQVSKNSDEEREKSGGVQALLETCNRLLEEQYSPESLQCAKKKEENMLENVHRYYIAYQNYMNRENILDPNGIVPGVSQRLFEQEKTTGQKTTQEPKESLIPKTPEQKDIEPENATELEDKTEDSKISDSVDRKIEDMTTEELEEADKNLQLEIEEAKRKIEEQKKREQLLASIAARQKELKSLMEELAKMNVNTNSQPQGSENR